MEVQQSWRLRFSFRNATMVVCFINVITAIFLLHGFLTSSYTRSKLPTQNSNSAQLSYIKESEEIRLAMLPLQLIKRVHTKRRNRLHQKKMNDLVYVMYNLKLKSKQVKRNLVIPFDELRSDDEWITEDGDANNIGDGENIQPPLSDENENVDDGGNAELEQGGGSTNQTLDDLEGLVFDDANIEEHLSSDEEDELEENEDDDGFDVGLDFD